MHDLVHLPRLLGVGENSPGLHVAFGHHDDVLPRYRAVAVDVCGAEPPLAPADADKDDRVTLTELTRAFDVTFADRSRYPEELAPVADRFFADDECAEVFNALDLDASGALSRSEYHKAVSAEFFYGDDPGSPANHIFGRLA